MANIDNIVYDLLNYFNSQFNLNLKCNAFYPVDLKTEEVIRSNNEDLTKRHIDLLNTYIETGDIIVNSYYSKHTDPSRKIKDFINLYKDIKHYGYNWNHRITLLNCKSILDLIDYNFCKDHPDRVINTFFKDKPVNYYRIDGSHRAAIAVVLKIDTLPCNIYEVVNV